MNFLRRTSTYGWLYIVSIFVFAGIYTSVDAGFVQANVRLEPAVQRLRYDIFENVQEHFVVRWMAFDSDDEFFVEFVPNRSERFETQGENQKPWSVSCEVVVFPPSKLPVTPSVTPKDYVESGTLTVETRLHGHPHDIESSVLCAREFFFRVGLSDPSSLAKPLAPFSEIGRVTGRTAFRINANTSVFFRDFVLLYSQKEGVIPRSSKNYVRFLYFSVVTATTLGFGDIVPINDRARALVVTQVLVSVFAIGMFLNGIAGSHSPRRN